MPEPTLLASLAALLTGPDGRPAAVEHLTLTAEQRAALRPASTPPSAALYVADGEQLRTLVPDATAAIVVGAEAVDDTRAVDVGAPPSDEEPYPLRPGGAVALVARTEVGGTHAALVDAVAAATAALSQTVFTLRAEAAVFDALNSVGRRLTAQLDLDRVVQDATDAATTAVGAGFGAFFYNLVNQFGESYTLYTLSGVPRAAFERFPCRATQRSSPRPSTARAPSAARTSPPTRASGATRPTSACPRDTCRSAATSPSR